MVEEIRELYAYNRWANHRTLGAAALLPVAALHRDLGSSFPSVFATLAHILDAEWTWLERWNGRSPTGARPAAALRDWPDLMNVWDEVERRQAEFVEGLQESDLRGTIDYRNTQGERFSAPLGQLLRHLVNHSTYHRGQVVTLLRQLGAEAVSTDMVHYYRERAAAPETLSPP